MFVIREVGSWTDREPEPIGRNRVKDWRISPEGERCLFKLPRTGEPGEVWAEKLAAEFAGLIGLPHAEIDLAIDDGRMGTVSPNFLQTIAVGDHRVRQEELVHGNVILCGSFPDYPADLPGRRVVGYTVEKVVGVLGKANPPRRWQAPTAASTAQAVFAGYLVFDAWVGNMDRHHNNWGWITSLDGGQPALAPTFDHGSSLGFNVRAGRRDTAIVDMAGFVRKDQSVFHDPTSGNRISTFDVVAAAQAIEPVGTDFWIERVLSVPRHEIQSLIQAIPVEIMDNGQREFVAAFLDARALELQKMRTR